MAPSQFTVDISQTLEAKLVAARCYETQFPADKEYIFDRIRAAAESTGLAAGFPAGEILINTRPLGTDDLMKTVELA